MRLIKILPIIFTVRLFCSISAAEQNEVFTLTAESLQNGGVVELNKLGWLYRAGDDLSWAARNSDESAWQRTEGTIIKPDSAPRGDWNGRGWFRLRLKIEDGLADKNLALAATQKGASEIYIDGVKLVDFGKITDAEITDEETSREMGIHAVYQIGDATNPTGLLGIGKPPNGKIFEDEEESLKALPAIAASSLANAKAHTEKRLLISSLTKKFRNFAFCSI
ncbi:MAG: hypothetical protein LH472_12235 [Pyrinomonadaceae bacterium]|nr:hypothetical protein [Pyrinomonadaceae bacterium]